MLDYKNEFHVDGSPDDVMRVFCDVKKMAACVPGAMLEGPDPEGAYSGTITVAFGPKKLRFTGKLNCEFDAAGRTGTLTGRGSAAVRGANALVRSTFAIVDAALSGSDAPRRSLVRLSIQGEFTGMMGEFAATAGPAVTSALLQEFAWNLNANFSRLRENAEIDSQDSVSATKLLWSAVKSRMHS